MSVISFGEVLVDFLSDGKTPESFTKYAGGAPANVAVGISKLGGESSFCGMLGNDMFGDFLHQELRDFGVNVDYCVATSVAKTALAFVSLDEQGERSFSFYRPPAADLLFKAEHFDQQMFASHSYFHFCSNSLTEKSIHQATMAGVELAKQHGLIISFDMNLRLNLWPHQRYTAERIWQCLSQSHIVKLAKEELTFLSKNSHKSISDEQTIARCLGLGVKHLIITDGDQPITIHSQDQISQIHVSPVAACDTTAAGDSFMAGVLYYLDKQAIDHTQLNTTEIIHAVEFGAKCAAVTVTRYGSFSALPSTNDL